MSNPRRTAGDAKNFALAPRSSSQAAKRGQSEATLERWRSDRIGPVFLKIRGRVLYRLIDIEAFEVTSLKGGFLEQSAQFVHRF